jgi:hypothetical protein
MLILGAENCARMQSMSDKFIWDQSDSGLDGCQSNLGIMATVEGDVLRAYLFFALRHIDWAAADKKFPQQVTPDMKRTTNGVRADARFHR